MPNSRETATLIWLGVAVLWMLVKPDIRLSLFGVGKAMVAPGILKALLATLVYVSALVTWDGHSECGRHRSSRLR